MAEDNRRQLGIFWGTKALYFSETEETNPEKSFSVPYEESTQADRKKSFLNPWEMALANSVKGTLSEHKVKTTTANLSLPIKDIIFRSFTVPWMQQHEIKNVVEFEISKYIPFSLDELSFSFHPIPMTDNDIKQFRIIFVAIKKDALENYKRILKAGSIEVNAAEPAASSIIRSLSFKNLIPLNETIALIEKEDVGRVTIIDQSIPQFVREFHLSPVSDSAQISPEDAIKRLSKEVRISLDYFNRLNDNLNVQKIIFLTSPDDKETSTHLEKYLDIPVVPITGQMVLSDAPESTAGDLNAYGASISGSVALPVTFDLSKHTTEKRVKQKKVIPKKPINYKALIKTACVCVPLIILTFVASSFWTIHLNKKAANLNQQLGPYQDSDASFIDQKEESLKAKLTQFKNVRLHSDTSIFLTLIPDLLPNGTWLRKLDIEYDDSAMFVEPAVNKKKKKNRRGKKAQVEEKAKPKEPTLIITIDGYAYSKDRNKQFRLINMLLQKLKGSAEFAGYFQEIDLETTSTQKLNEHNVTSFKIVCKQTDESQRPK